MSEQLKTPGRGDLRLGRDTRPACASAFTLVELLVAMALFAAVVVLVLKITDQTTNIWRSSTARIQTFQEARAAFEAMTRTLSQATLNTYYDYYEEHEGRMRPRVGLTPSELAAFNPKTYDRLSDLHFIAGRAATLLENSPNPVITQTQAVFFQAPLGYSVTYQKLDNALNACGYFIQFGDDTATVPDHVSTLPGYQPRHRFRLMELTQRTEHLGVYDPVANPNSWFVDNAVANSRVIAENVIALILLPRLSSVEDPSGIALAPAFNYNSRIPLGALSDPDWAGFPGNEFTITDADNATMNATRHHQLPPMMQVIMIVIDEESGARIQGTASTPPAAINLAATNLFLDAANLDADLRAVEDICSAADGNVTGNTIPLTYRVFKTDIIMREAKWSNN